MEKKFKPGDKVTIINFDGYNPGNLKGKVFTIRETQGSDGGQWWYVFEESTGYRFKENNLKLACKLSRE